MTEEQELAWLAGLLEGEGSFMMVNNHVSNLSGRVYRYPCVTVNMTDRDVIEHVAAILNRKVYNLRPPMPGRLTPFRAIITGEPAAQWMTRLLPFMGSRRQNKIKECLAEWDSRQNANEGRKLSMKRAVKRRERKKDGTFRAAPAVMADFARE